jgi:SepF-like predicted cell division protein (DUF552 family)
MRTTQNDLENLTKATQTSQLLVSDIQDLHKSENAILSSVAYDLLKEAAELHLKLKRLSEAVEVESKKAEGVSI